MRERQQHLFDEVLPQLSLSKDELSSLLQSLPGSVSQSLWLEIGAGGGEHAIEQARLNPQITYVASEFYRNGLCSLLSKIVPREGEEKMAVPPTFRIWPQDGRILLDMLPEKCLTRVYLMFPDPWPKVRHAKRRFVHPANITALSRVIRPGGEWRIASDHPIYQEWVDQVMSQQTFFILKDCRRGKRPDGWSATRYEQKAVREGRVPFYWTFTRRDAS